MAVRTIKIKEINETTQQLAVVDIESIVTLQNQSAVTIGVMIDDRILTEIPTNERSYYYIHANEERTFSNISAYIYIKSMSVKFNAHAVMIKS